MGLNSQCLFTKLGNQRDRSARVVNRICYFSIMHGIHIDTGKYMVSERIAGRPNESRLFITLSRAVRGMKFVSHENYCREWQRWHSVTCVFLQRAYKRRKIFNVSWWIADEYSSLFVERLLLFLSLSMCRSYIFHLASYSFCGIPL